MPRRSMISPAHISWAHHGKVQSLQTNNFKIIFNSSSPWETWYWVGKSQHSFAGSISKDTANIIYIIYIIMTHSKIRLELIKGNSLPTLKRWKAWQKINVPSQLKPFPMCFGLQEQLYEPWLLMHEAFGWHLFILEEWASLHSSMSER